MAGEVIGGATNEGFQLATEIDVGTYFTIAETHQILLGYSMDLIHKPEWEFAAGPLALGYNVMLNDKTELITELDFNIPAADADFTMGISAGLIIEF